MVPLLVPGIQQASSYAVIRPRNGTAFPDAKHHTLQHLRSAMAIAKFAPRRDQRHVMAGELIASSRSSLSSGWSGTSLWTRHPFPRQQSAEFHYS